MPEKNTSVLIVEDEVSLANMFAIKLRKLGMEVTVVGSGDSALELLAQGNSYDIVLLDVLMPGLDGFVVLERIRANPATKDLKVYIFSNLTQEGEQKKAKDLGATGFIIKANFSPSQLASYIQQEITT
jgi:CheY-like chemotaxis protein